MRHFLLFAVLLCGLISACKKDDPDPFGPLSSSSITYQLKDTLGNYQTQYECNLYASANGAYLDSIFIVQDVYGLTDPYYSNPLKLDYGFFDLKKYILANYYNVPVDSSQVALVKFNPIKRLGETYDYYNLLTDENAHSHLGQAIFFSYDVFTPVIDTILAELIPDADAGSQSDIAFHFKVLSYSADSMVIVRLANFSPPYPSTSFQYTVYFDNKDNNTDLLLLSGYPANIFTDVSNLSEHPESVLIGGGSFVYMNYIERIPFPNLNMRLAKSIRITTLVDEPVDFVINFSYQFDSEDRVTKATLTAPNGFDERVLITY